MEVRYLSNLDKLWKCEIMRITFLKNSTKYPQHKIIIWVQGSINTVSVLSLNQIGQRGHNSDCSKTKPRLLAITTDSARYCTFHDANLNFMESIQQQWFFLWNFMISRYSQDLNNLHFKERLKISWIHDCIAWNIPLIPAYLGNAASKLCIITNANKQQGPGFVCMFKQLTRHRFSGFLIQLRYFDIAKLAMLYVRF